MIQILRHLTVAAAALAVAIVIPPATALATGIAPMSPEDLAEEAELIAVGVVRTITCERDDTFGVVTRVELEVSAIWKGERRKTLTLSQPGGVLGRRRVEVHGAPKFRLGEEAVFFCQINPRGHGLVLSLNQGMLRVTRDADANTSTVENRWHRTEFASLKSFEKWIFTELQN